MLRATHFCRLTLEKTGTPASCDSNRPIAQERFGPLSRVDIVRADNRHLEHFARSGCGHEERRAPADRPILFIHPFGLCGGAFRQARTWLLKVLIGRLRRTLCERGNAGVGVRSTMPTTPRATYVVAKLLYSNILCHVRLLLDRDMSQALENLTERDNCD